MNNSIFKSIIPVFIFVVISGIPALKSQITQTFTYTGALQTFTVPVCVTSITADVRGAQGGGTTGSLGGNGGRAQATMTVIPGEVLQIYVGGAGTYTVSTPTGGYNGGAGFANLYPTTTLGGTGGGASDIRRGTGLSNRIIVAGGGGGGSNSSSNNRAGGDGGGLIGGTGGAWPTYASSGGAGGTQLAGGAAGIACCNTPYPGTFGVGGNGDGDLAAGCGGGGGWYGGGGGLFGGGGGGSSYLNYPGHTFTSTTSGFQTGNGLIILSYNTNGSGVSASASSLAICTGATPTLTASNVLSYTWAPGGSNATSITVNPASNTSYTVQGTNSLGCISSAIITITVSPALPVITITNTANNICLGKTATLTAGGALSYTWAGGPGGIINGQTFTPTGTSNYTVTGQNGCGISTAVTSITVAPLVVSATASPSLSCSGNPATLTAASAVTGYTWYPVAVPNFSTIVLPTVTTVYTVVASDGTCAGVATVTITAKPNPTISINTSATTVCQGAIVTLTASGALTYTWTSPSSNAPNISDNPITTTLYQVSGTNSVNCVSSANQLVFTQASPTVVVTSDKNLVCSGDPVNLTASGATTYNWTNGPATAGNIVNPTGNTTYSVTGTTSPCSGTAAITINVLTASVLASVATPSICNGATAVLHASGATSYTWVGQSTFVANANVNPTITTIYTVNAITTSGTLTCPSSTNITVTVFNNPTVTIVATKSVACKTDAPIVLTGGGATTYTWSTATVSANISVHPQSTTTYSITGMDANGCVNTASKVITVTTCNGMVELNDKKNSISIYPNPSQGDFTIQANEDVVLILLNELGQTIRIIALTESTNYKTSVSDLAQGVYFLTGLNNNLPFNQKVVVTK